jgi:hypothetical protein
VRTFESSKMVDPAIAGLISTDVGGLIDSVRAQAANETFAVESWEPHS